MGPYCKFCARRCFMLIPNTAPSYVLTAYGTATIAATCERGKADDLQRIGFCADDFEPSRAVTNETYCIEYRAKDPVAGVWWHTVNHRVLTTHADAVRAAAFLLGGERYIDGTPFIYRIVRRKVTTEICGGTEVAPSDQPKPAGAALTNPQAIQVLQDLLDDHMTNSLDTDSSLDAVEIAQALKHAIAALTDLERNAGGAS